MHGSWSRSAKVAMVVAALLFAVPGVEALPMAQGGQAEEAALDFFGWVTGSVSSVLSFFAIDSAADLSESTFDDERHISAVTTGNEAPVGPSLGLFGEAGSN